MKSEYAHMAKSIAAMNSKHLKRSLTQGLQQLLNCSIKPPNPMSALMQTLSNHLYRKTSAILVFKDTIDKWLFENTVFPI